MAFNHQHDNALTDFDVQNPSSKVQSSNEVLVIKDPGYPDLPQLGFTEPDSQWDDSMSFSLDVDALKEHELIKSLKAMDLGSEVEGEARNIIHQTTNTDLAKIKELKFTPFGLNELKYIEQGRTLHGEQGSDVAVSDSVVRDVPDAYPSTWPIETPMSVINALGRQVILRNDASEVVQHSGFLHTTLVSYQSSCFHRSLDAYAKLAAKLNFQEDRTKVLVYEQAYMRVSILQTMCIEPMVGKFSHDDQEYVDNFVDFGERLLAVMYVGLVMKESFGPLSGSDTNSRVLADILGSCLLEARKWQLGLLGAWITELDNLNVKMNELVSQSLLA